MSDPCNTDTESVPSPCISICVLDEQEVCQGCYRTLTEIGRWSSASAAEQREMLAASLQRQEQQ